MKRRRLSLTLLAATGPAFADTDPTPVAGEEIHVESDAPRPYKANRTSLSKLTESTTDTPQSIDVISSGLMKDRAVTNLNDTLRTVPGISLGAGEFSWQGNNVTIRGFLARNDMFLDGVRDFGSYSRDPFAIEQVEVLEGPSSVLFGRGSTGGAINQASKLPTRGSFVKGSVVAGSDLTRRGTIDINQPVEELGEDAALRFAGMVHAQNVTDRDEAKLSRAGLSPSLAMNLGKATRLTASYLGQTSSDVPDYGLPWFGTRPAPVPRDTYYGYSSDSLKTEVNVGTLRVEHEVTKNIALRNTFRYSHSTRDFRISEPIISQPITTPVNELMVGFNIWSGNSVETMAWDQAEGVVSFSTGPVKHKLVIGIEGGRESSTPEFDNSAGVPSVSLTNPDPDREFNAMSTYPRLAADTTARSFAPYAIDTAKITDQLEVSGGLRWDHFSSHYTADRYSTTEPGVVMSKDDVERTDKKASWRAAIVYKPLAPTTNGNVYLAYGTSFNPSAETLSQITSGRGLGIGNKDLAPEKNKSFELGTKWDVLGDRLSVTGAFFRLEKDNARVPDAMNPGFNTLAGKQRVDGFSAGIVGYLTPLWQLTAGYTYLDGKLTESVEGAPPVGSPLPNTPKSTFALFTVYKLGRVMLGGGTYHSSGRYAQNTQPLRAVPGYWTFDAMARGDLTKRLSLQLNVVNVANKFYYDQLHPWHVVPGAGRTALLTLDFSY